MGKDRVFFYLCEKFNVMNYIDIIVLLTLAFAIFSGWKQGAIVQGCSILGILVAGWLASKYSTDVGLWLHIKAEWATVSGFIIIFFAAVVGVAVIARVVKSIFKFVGLGPIDIVLGVVLSICKFVVILSLLFGAFDYVNSKFNIVKRDKITNSMLYTPIKSISGKIFPAIDWTQKQIHNGLEPLQ